MYISRPGLMLCPCLPWKIISNKQEISTKWKGNNKNNKNLEHCTSLVQAWCCAPAVFLFIFSEKWPRGWMWWSSQKNKKYISNDNDKPRIGKRKAIIMYRLEFLWQSFFVNMDKFNIFQRDDNSKYFLINKWKKFCQ